MNIQELLQVIRNEKLYEYTSFQIGPPHGENNVGTWSSSGDTQGVFMDEDGVWRRYRQSERGGIQMADYTSNSEDEACKAFLEMLRSHKNVAITSGWKKTDYHIQNRAKWFAEEPKRRL